MKLIHLLAILSLALSLYSANVSAVDDVENDYIKYCEEQADMSDIETTEEKTVFIKECIESFEVQTNNAPQQD